ncbi:hypothetical protein [Amycolatopsis thermophila]|uniref:Uncharacterized protein n=1 Tax=Amycolatopsis thermophila TaxID=206084 RepID=A0ABU0F124_9PSEU|nr:hypothetical protein [Amycolatopsis thermophila]MDQ0381272.1 hypothetical protein [Amycolatopsis thermophila]
MTAGVAHPRPATPRGGPWSPAVRRLLHERGVDPRSFDVGPHRLTRRILETLLAVPDPVPAGGGTDGHVVAHAHARVRELAGDDLAVCLAAAVVRAWQETQDQALTRLVLDSGGRRRELPPVTDRDRITTALTAARAPAASGGVRLVLGSAPGIRLVPSAADGEVVIAAGAPSPAVVPVRLATGECTIGCRTTVPLTLVSTGTDAASLLGAVVTAAERYAGRET